MIVAGNCDGCHSDLHTATVYHGVRLCSLRTSSFARAGPGVGVISLCGVGRPYWDSRVDVLDCACCVSILLHLVATVYFNDAAFNLDDDLNPTTRASQLDTLLVVVNIFIMCSIALLFAWTFLENVFRIRGRSVLARLVATNVVSLQANLQRHRTQFVDALKSGSVEGRVSLECFTSAAEQCLSQDGIAPVRYMLEAAYITLKSYAGMKHDDVEAAQLELPLSTVTLCRQPSVRLRYRLQTASAVHLHRLRCAALQVLEFVGDRQATSWRAGLMQREKSVRQLTKQNSNKSVRHNSADAAAGAAGLWQTFRAEQIAKKVCEEIYSSLDAAKLHAWIYRYQADPGRLMGLFCLSAWLAPHIPRGCLFSWGSCEDVQSRIVWDAKDSHRGRLRRCTRRRRIDGCLEEHHESDFGVGGKVDPKRIQDAACN